jgi:hypothetical protein
MNSSDHMKNISAELISLFRAATVAAFPDLPEETPCPVVPSAKFADYQYNGAMPIAGLLKVGSMYYWNRVDRSFCQHIITFYAGLLAPHPRASNIAISESAVFLWIQIFT